MAAPALQEDTVKALQISTQLRLPIDAVTQTLAAIGRKGSGKTYLATMICEQMLDAGAQVAAVDPVGNWFGLRVGADGKSKGKEIFVIGGEHGDVPLTPEVGAKIARLVVEKRISVVLDVSSFRQGERKRFAADFAEELFHLKKSQRTPLHVFLEEAQLFAPQRPGPDDARMLGAFEHIVRLGRNYGIGCTLVTQRPQSVNKEVLSQVECLCVLQVNGVHERKALEEWVQEAGADRKLVGELPSLGRGEGYVWSPSWLKIFERVRFAQKKTFDASATPEVGKAARAASLSTVDVEALKADLQEVVAAAEKDDPKALRRELAARDRKIAELEKLSTRLVDRSTLPPLKEIRVEVPTVKDAQVKRLELQVARLVKAAELAAAAAHDLRPGLAAAAAPRPPARPAAPPLVVNRKEFLRPERGVVPARAAPAGAGDVAVGNSGLRRMLIALAQRPQGLTNAQLGVRAGVSSRSGTFSTYLGRARSQGWIDGRGVVKFTDAGLAALGAYDPLPEGRELAEYWIRKLGGGASRMLRVLVDAYPGALTNEQLGQAAQISHVSGTFSTYLGRLRALELVEGRGELRASEELAS
jgi:hypothetical protein